MLDFNASAVVDLELFCCVKWVPEFRLLDAIVFAHGVRGFRGEELVDVQIMLACYI